MNYRRMTSNGSIGWNCDTYLSKGKKYCQGKKIPESTLKTVCASVLGMDAYHPNRLKEQIVRIEALDGNRLRFAFKDGHIEEHTWADRSRAESWTPEMKEYARTKAKNRKEINSCQQ